MGRLPNYGRALSCAEYYKVEEGEEPTNILPVRQVIIFATAPDLVRKYAFVMGLYIDNDRKLMMDPSYQLVYLVLPNFNKKLLID